MNLMKKKIFITIKHNKNNIQKLPLFKGNIPEKHPIPIKGIGAFYNNLYNKNEVTDKTHDTPRNINP